MGFSLCNTSNTLWLLLGIRTGVTSQTNGLFGALNNGEGEKVQYSWNAIA
jgi:hypothetical protein